MTTILLPALRRRVLRVCQRGGGKLNVTAKKSTFAIQEIKEGEMIRAKGQADIYIVKYSHGKKFNRLILRPKVSASYGHLKWENVEEADRSVLDASITSYHVFVAGEGKIWRLEPDGSSGVKRGLEGYGNDEGEYDPDGLYGINATDRNSYLAGEKIER